MKGCASPRFVNDIEARTELVFIHKRIHEIEPATEIDRELLERFPFILQIEAVEVAGFVAVIDNAERHIACLIAVRIDGENQRDRPDGGVLLAEKKAAACVNRLKRAAISQFKAKDIFRASGLSLLGISNAHVEKDQQKIQSGHQLSPLLLIRDSVNGKVIVADGYHRLCAVYSYDENAVIPCKIA